MELSFLIKKYSEVELNNFAELPYDEKYGATLKVGNEGIEIRFEPSVDGSTCYLFTFLCELPNKFLIEFYNMLLAGHLFGKFTNDCYFGLDSSSKRIIFFKNIKIDKIEQSEFNEAVNSFIKASFAWKDAITEKYNL